MKKVIWFFITSVLFVYKRIIIIIPIVVITTFLIINVSMKNDLIFSISINKGIPDTELTIEREHRTPSIPSLNLNHFEDYNTFKNLEQINTLYRNKGEYQNSKFDDDYIKIENRNDLVKYLGFSKLEAKEIERDEFLRYKEFNIMETATSSVTDEEKTLRTTIALLGSEKRHEETSLFVKVTITWNEIPKNRGFGYLGIALPDAVRRRTDYSYLPFGQDHILKSRKVYKENDQVKIEQSSEDYVYYWDDFSARIELPKQNVTELHHSVEYNLTADRNNDFYNLLDINQIQILGHYTHINKDSKESGLSFVDINNGIGIKYKPYDVYKYDKPISTVTTFDVDQFLIEHTWKDVVDDYDRGYSGNNTASLGSYVHESGDVYATLHDSNDIDFYRIIAYRECSLNIEMKNIPVGKDYRFDIVDHDGNVIENYESLDLNDTVTIESYKHKEKALIIKVYSPNGSYDMHQRYILSIEIKN